MTEPIEPTDPDVGPGIEEGPDIDLPDETFDPTDDSRTTVVADSTPGGD